MRTVDELPGRVERVKDSVSYAAGRVSHAVRNNLPGSEIMLRRQQLSGVQIEKYLGEQYPPTVAKAKMLCAMLMDQAKQADAVRAEMAEREAAEVEVA